ncbi:MAG: TIM barrel protein [Phycisphaerae bacterium]|nr:sugar phosphate isomerase/epimerase [Phycisphaerae bacterium]NIP52238.1 sugar phosphate isomerase/epimerase [Phycisphaerae bacterium]NIS49801.1 sugar phosphate isomerase/epimerase [Phycisphaerae bacterium]NIU07540.1 sugar phosphate isomerase/epimerase [Phycisphaerae bacterium]NIU59748.1 TIM barrel protein [Phycisphaerae bacterium]
MKISASYWMFEGGLEATKPIAEAMQEAKDLGFEAIELAIGSKGVLTEKTTQAECEEIVATSQKIGIEISSIASGESWGCSPTANDDETRAKIIDFTRKALQVTKWLGTDAYLFVPGAVDVFFLPDAEVIPYDVCYERAEDAIKQLLSAAEETGVTICVENVWNKFLLSPLEMRDFIDSFNSQMIGAYFDVGNVLLTGYPDHWIRILGERIKRVHVKDFKLSVGTVEGFVDLLEGDVDFEEVKKALADVVYDGYITAELLPFEPGRPEKTAQAMKKIFK